jgi:hypothetical protein
MNRLDNLTHWVKVPNLVLCSHDHTQVSPCLGKTAKGRWVHPPTTVHWDPHDVQPASLASAEHRGVLDCRHQDSPATGHAPQDRVVNGLRRAATKEQVFGPASKGSSDTFTGIFDVGPGPASRAVNATGVPCLAHKPLSSFTHGIDVS